MKHETISFDPNRHNSDSSVGGVVLRMICQGLLKIDHHGELAPDLAKSWNVSDDLRVFEFELDPEATFHSGRRCDAEIVAWNFERLFSGTGDSLLAADYAGLESVRPTGKHRVEFRFSKPNASFLRNVAWRTYIVDDRADQPIGTGPFRLTEWQRNSHMALETFREDSRWKDLAIDNVDIRFAPSAEARIEAIEKGLVDIVESVPAGAAAELGRRGLLETAAVPSLQKSALVFNCAEPPFDDPRLRRAVVHAIDRARLVDATVGTQGRIVDGIVPKGELWACDLDPITYDPELSRKLLQEAGFGGGLKIKGVSTNVAPMPKVAKMVAEDLSAIGITLETTGYDDPPWWPYVYTMAPWNVAFQGSPARPHIDTFLGREFKTTGAFNAGKYSNARLDEIIELARHSLGTAEQEQLYSEAQRIIRQDLPVYILFAANVLVGWRPGVSGFVPHPMGAIDLTSVDLGAQ
ncbi:ABC transporter substrate-binding protein [Pelagibius sp. CAU 1746]|uniref:ABC transporter substrate-binding protein n=1 Tax=Pelagibius sp. CAU 1746 TaxID=3140370 RepID=UPI00325B19CE